MAESYALPPRVLAVLQDMPLEQLALTPVPVKARHDGWTVERQKWFILRLAPCGQVAVAARAEWRSPKITVSPPSRGRSAEGNGREGHG